MRLAALEEAPYAFGSTYQREVGFDGARWRWCVTDRVIYVAEVDGVVVGAVSGVDGEVNGSAAMIAMWVDPRFRRQGVGDVLVKTVMEWARGKRYGQMFLWVTEVNAGAERLYARNGFVRTGATQEVRPGELEHDMSRLL